MLPNLIIFGAAKAGTSSLHWFLEAHPDIFMSNPKELSFFLPDRNWSRGIDWYSQHFSSLSAEQALIRGESTPYYGRGWKCSGIPERIESVLPEAKFICIARSPIERMISEYHHRRSNGTESRGIDEAMRDLRYHEWSRYYDQVTRYTEVFGMDNVLVVIAERLFDNDGGEIRRIAKFLEVDPNPLLGRSFKRVNRTANRAVRPQVIRRLATTGVYRAASKGIPPSVRQKWRSVTSQKYSQEERTRRPSESTMEWMRTVLQEDTEGLKRMLDDPIADWT